MNERLLEMAAIKPGTHPDKLREYVSKAASTKFVTEFVDLTREACAKAGLQDEVSTENVHAVAEIVIDKVPADLSMSIGIKLATSMRGARAAAELALLPPPDDQEEKKAGPVTTEDNGQWKPRPRQRKVTLPDPSLQRKKVTRVIEPDQETMEAEERKIRKGLDESAPLDATAALYVKGLLATAPVLAEKVKDTEPAVKRRAKAKHKEQDEVEGEEGDTKEPQVKPAPTTARTPKKEKEPAVPKSADNYASAMNNAEVAREELAELINDTPILQDLLTYAIEMTDEEKKNYGGPAKQKKALLEEFGKVLRGVRAARVRRGLYNADEYATDQLIIYVSILIVIGDLLDPELQGRLPADEKSEFADELLRHYKKFDGDTRGPLKELYNRIQRGEKALRKQIAEIGNIDSFVLRFVENFQKFRLDLKEAGRNALYSAINAFDGSEPLGSLIEREVLAAIEKAKQGTGKRKKNT